MELKKLNQKHNKKKSISPTCFLPLFFEYSVQFGFATIFIHLLQNKEEKIHLLTPILSLLASPTPWELTMPSLVLPVPPLLTNYKRWLDGRRVRMSKENEWSRRIDRKRKINFLLSHGFSSLILYVCIFLAFLFKICFLVFLFSSLSLLS